MRVLVGSRDDVESVDPWGTPSAKRACDREYKVFWQACSVNLFDNVEGMERCDAISGQGQSFVPGKSFLVRFSPRYEAAKFRNSKAIGICVFLGEEDIAGASFADCLGS